MICPNCQTANPAVAKFCFNCGILLPREEKAGPDSQQQPVLGSQPGPETSPASGTEPYIGSPPASTRDAPGGVREPSGPIPSSRASNPASGAAPAGASSRLGDRAIASERRVVTILFCDVKGSTTLAEQLDPEAWAELMNAAFSELLSPIGKYGGTVARLMGDAVLAFFGAPTAHEDDPQRAVLTGLEIIANVQAFRARVQQQY